MEIKRLFAVMSVSAIPAVTSAAVTADVQQVSRGAVDAMPVASGVAGIFTLSAGPIPVTERTRQGERKLMALENAYARKIGWLPPNHDAAAADGQLAMLPIGASGTWDCTGGGNDPGGGGCTADTDAGF